MLSLLGKKRDMFCFSRLFLFHANVVLSLYYEQASNKPRTWSGRRLVWEEITKDLHALSWLLDLKNC